MDPVISPGATGICTTIKNQGDNSGDGEDDETDTVGNRRQHGVVKRALALGSR